MYIDDAVHMGRKEKQGNRQKHGISFEAAAQVFDDPNATMYQDLSIDGEERWQTVGFAREALLVVLVIHTITNDNGGELIRIDPNHFRPASNVTGKESI